MPLAHEFKLGTTVCLPITYGTPSWTPQGASRSHLKASFLTTFM